jgi:hypothetical protein
MRRLFHRSAPALWRGSAACGHPAAPGAVSGWHHASHAVGKPIWKLVQSGPLHAQVGYLVTGYSVALFGFYSLVPAVLRWSGAGVLNLSLLSANLWAALARAAFLGMHACVGFTSPLPHRLFTLRNPCQKRYTPIAQKGNLWRLPKSAQPWAAQHRQRCC